MKDKISIIGCGRVGTAIAVYSITAGYTVVGLASRTVASAEKTCQVAGAGQVYEDALSAAMAGDILFITTPDDAIEPVCASLSDRCREKLSGKIVYHCSGALSSAILSSAKKWGASTGSIHPLQSFAPYTLDQSSPFKGINISVEGDEAAVALGKTMVHGLGANAFSIPTKAKTLYHAAAVVASNYLVTLEDFAIQLLKSANLEPQTAYEILEPLIQGTLTNIKNRGSIEALTGPVARGDVEIVERHLEDIDEYLPDYSALYRTLGRYTLDLANRKRGLSDETAAEMKKVLAPSS